jgi:hypothetical protein
MKVVNKLWFTNTDCVGIVLCENEYDEKRAYIKKVDGYNEEQDTQTIMDWGSTITLSQAQEIVNHLTPKPDDAKN